MPADIDTPTGQWLYLGSGPGILAPVVHELPVAPAHGDRVQLTVDAANNVRWLLLFESYQRGVRPPTLRERLVFRVTGRWPGSYVQARLENWTRNRFVADHSPRLRG